MQYLFDAWADIEKRIYRTRYIFLCADFDGTIVRLKPRPKDAKLNKSLRQLLSKISKANSFIAAIISGRALKDIQKKVGLKSLIFAGNHGLEIAYQNKKFIYPQAKRHLASIAAIARDLKKRLLPFRGAILEEKVLSLSLHHRLVKKQKLSLLKKTFLEIIKPYLDAQKIKFTYGKKVWELRPPIDWDKGKAVLWLIRRLKKKRTLTIFIGDDLTDEDGFRAVNRIGGITIVVGRNRRSAARYFLRNTKDTRKFLEKIYQKRCPQD